MTKDERRLMAASLVDALIDGGHIERSKARRMEAIRAVSGRLAEIERCGGSYQSARVSLADHIDDTYSIWQEGD